MLKTRMTGKCGKPSACISASKAHIALVFGSEIGMFTRVSLSAVIILAAVIWATMVWWMGAELSWRYITPFGAVVTIVSVGLTLFDRVLWCCWPFSTFSGVPDLRGNWDIELKRVLSIHPQMKRVDPLKVRRSSAKRYQLYQSAQGLADKLRF